MPAAGGGRTSAYAHYRAPLTKRYTGALLDFIVSAAPVVVLMIAYDSMLYRILGALFATLYILLKDNLFLKALTPSPGKNSVGLRVEPVKGQRDSINVFESILRNLPIAIGPLILMIPMRDPYVPTLGLMFWGFSMVVEGLIIFREEEGRRLGDQLAGTKVFD